VKTFMAELSEKLQKLAQEIETLNVLELSELAKYLEEKFGVQAMAMAAPAAGGAAPAAGAAPAEEKTAFTVMLTDAGANKLAVIKAVREVLPNLGLMEAKKLVESAPQQVLADAKKADADAAKTKIEAAGGKVELK
jgi:large subunit ribosomal protein L7/L12